MSDVERQSGLPATNFVVRGLIYLIELYRHTVSPLRLITALSWPCSS